jgi:hypothetical protein
MVPKKIFSKNQSFLNEVVIKKILNKNLYEKSYIRGFLMDSKTIQIVDNNATFYNWISQGVSKIYNKSISEGSSLGADTFFYKNRLNSNLKFRSFMLNSIKSENLLDSFYNSLKTLEVGLKSCYPSLLVLKPLKGGFACYSSGIYGFLPRSHGVYFIAKTLVSILKDKEVSNRLPNLSYLLQNSKTLKTSFLMRLEFLLGKVTFYLPASKQDSFFSLSKKRKEAFVNDYNFIFLSQRVQKFKLNKKIPLVLNAKIKKINPKKIKKIVKK